MASRKELVGAAVAEELVGVAVGHETSAGPLSAERSRGRARALPVARRSDDMFPIVQSDPLRLLLRSRARNTVRPPKQKPAPNQNPAPKPASCCVRSSDETKRAELEAS